MKFKLLLSSISCAGLFLVGCALMSKPPTKFEEHLFDVITNHVTVVDHVTVTNRVEQVLFQTNQIGQIITFTNVMNQYELKEVLHTNEVYNFAVKDSTTTGVSVAGTISNLVAPGSGGVVVGVLGGILAMWARLRSWKQTGSVLSQNIEAMREFIKTLPQGSKYDTAITGFIQAHQLEAGVANQVLTLLENENLNPQAKAAVVEIKSTIDTLSKTT